MTAVDLLMTSAGTLHPAAAAAVTLAKTATLIAETGTAAVESMDRRVEARLLVIHREGAQLNTLLSEIQRHPAGSTERAAAQAQYRAVLADLERQQQALTGYGAHFLRSALTDAPSLYHAAVFVARQKFQERFMDRFVRWLKPKERVRWSLTRLTTDLSTTRAKWQALDRDARRVGDAVEELVKRVGKKMQSTVVSSAIDPGLTLAVQYHYADCFNAVIVWMRTNPVLRDVSFPRTRDLLPELPALAAVVPAPVLAVATPVYVAEPLDVRATRRDNDAGVSVDDHGGNSLRPSSSEPSPAPAHGLNLPDLGPTYHKAVQIHNLGGHKFDTR